MADLKSPTLIYLKGLLFLLLGLFSAGWLLVQAGSWQVAALLAIAIWAFCRAYYFVFYVIEHYVDPQYKFAGLGSFLAYLWANRQRKASTSE
ncbi:hypothetical protein [Blastopirellula marina]|uniref:Uncharacterized protein n=1 Tax=Blastopirellula marina TaxID=124 RepID=A0A2S8GNG8_9BACT|nr:hypothetical protein [Blastopirellula marina]PQO45574.1 hypothetical protein C5Y93_14130 [Blastopirellula marina]